MSWTSTGVTGKKRNITLLEETFTLPASATIGYSTVIDDFGPNLDNNNRWISASFNASAVTGTNLDIALYGASSDGGTKFLLKDAVVADITATGTVAGLIDLNAYPAAFYYLAWTADVDESANTITVKVMGSV
jgi:hypothetical protein